MVKVDDMDISGEPPMSSRETSACQRDSIS